MGKLEGKTALITACTRGIGKAIVEKLSEEGAAVYMAVRRPDAAQEIADSLNAKGRQVKVVSYDGFSLDTIGPMVEEVIRQAGRIDILVNNQGGNGKGVKADLDVVNTPAEIFENQLSFNLTSTYTCCQKVIPNMVENGGGVIVNIASMNGEFADMVRTGYGVSKAALDKLTQNIAMQYGRANIRCNAVAPGFIKTEAALSLPQQFIDGYVRHLPIKRLGEVEDIANAVLFFASDDSAWVSGQILEVAGGFGCGTPMYADMVEK